MLDGWDGGTIRLSAGARQLDTPPSGSGGGICPRLEIHFFFSAAKAAPGAVAAAGAITGLWLPALADALPTGPDTRQVRRDSSALPAHVLAQNGLPRRFVRCWLMRGVLRVLRVSGAHRTGGTTGSLRGRN